MVVVDRKCKEGERSGLELSVNQVWNAVELCLCLVVDTIVYNIIVDNVVLTYISIVQLRTNNEVLHNYKSILTGCVPRD